MEAHMTRRALQLRIAALAGVVIVAASLAGVRAGQVAAPAVAIDNDDIGGVVTGPRGPEAGVWVIAETTDLPTRLIKSVVTDDQGRYLVPDLPKATYDVWVRGYGLVDSPKVKSAPGKALNLHSRARAERRKRRRSTTRRSTGCRCCRCRPRAISPAPARQATAFRRTSGARASGSATSSTPTAAPAAIRWATRRRARSPRALGTFDSSVAAWDRRVQSGQAGGGMSARFTQVGRPARARDVGGLDRSHCGGRAAGRSAAAAAGQRAQRRRDDVGLGRSEGVSARRDRERQAQSDA